MDLISIIVPVYNVEKYLKKCVHSLRMQTYPMIEIILVDDGSTDGSSKICDEFSEMDSRIKVIHKENGGLSDARNAGIKQAIGKYYSFIDSDDYIENDMLEELHDLAVTQNCQITISNMRRFYEDGSTEGFYEPVDSIICYEGNFKFETLKQPSVCNKLFVAELFRGIWFPKGKFYEDTFVYHELVYKANKVGLTGKQGYWYLSRKESILGREQYTIRYFDFLEAVYCRMHFLIEHEVEYYGIEACLSYYSAYSNAVKYIKCDENMSDHFVEAKRWYLYAYNELINSKDISIKQKIRLILLKYIPEVHSHIF